MAATASPYGLRPLNLIGGQPYNGGVIREFTMGTTNNSAAIFNGDLIVLSAGIPAAVATTSPTAQIIPTTPGNSTNATAGIVGVCVGASFVSPAIMKQQLFAQYLPVNAYNNGYRDVAVRVMDDPDALFQIQGTAALGTYNSGTNGSGWRGAIGKNAAISFGTAGSTTTGNSGLALVVGADGGSIATTSTLALRIVDVVRGTESDNYPEFIVKLNHTLHSYYNPLGVA
jgi:hypothetical protein